MQGFNMGRYYPPSHSTPRFNTSSTLKTTQKRGAAGSQTVRFEMPFHVWCAHCPAETIIPQGVRFNAIKTKVGDYHSTPMWSFGIVHTVCGGKLDIRTDPKNAEYVVHSGGKKRDYGVQEKGVGEERFLGEEERARRREDAFAGLEGRLEEKKTVQDTKERVGELYGARERDWADPYEASQRLRRGFRAERKARMRQEEKRGMFREKYGLEEDFQIVDETEGDRTRAGLIEFGSVNSEDIHAKPLFALEETNKKKDIGKGLTKSEREALRRKIKLQEQLQDNTRAVLDPFRISKGQKTPKSLLALKGVKPLVSAADGKLGKDGETSKASVGSIAPTTPALVDYDSD